MRSTTIVALTALPVVVLAGRQNRVRAVRRATVGGRPPGSR
jgi:hypothetical protein